MIKWSIQEDDITIVNTYAPNIGAPRYIQQILADIKGEINGITIIVGDFNTPLTSMDRPSRQETTKATDPKGHNRKVRLSWHFGDITCKKNQNIHSSQVHMEHSQGLITYCGTKLTSTNLRL